MLNSAQKSCCEQSQPSICPETTFHRVNFKKENVIDHTSDNVGVLLCLSQSLPCSKSIAINIQHFYSNGQNPFLLIPAGAAD